jgi:hypothetical protein
LRKGKDVQTYGLGVKEVWEVPKETFKAGLIQHTLGWPLQNSPFSQVFGGSFLYHLEPNLVLIGMVIGLDYENPYTNPYKEFQVSCLEVLHFSFIADVYCCFRHSFAVFCRIVIFSDLNIILKLRSI